MSGVVINLKGQRALITGGSRGIGKATAIYFAQAGCDVAISYQRNARAAEETKAQLEALGVAALAIKADFSSPAEAVSMVEKVLEEWGGVDILVNNAGIWTYGEMGEMTPEVWEETIRVNLSSIFYTCNAIVPAMKMRKKGVIINVSSTAGVRGEAYHSHYAATKGALISLTKSLAVELAPYGIRVNCVASGWVDTDMCEEVFADQEYKEKVRQSIPVGRIPPPEDIAGPILFLASNLARHITGEVLNVNGGAVLCGG